MEGGRGEERERCREGEEEKGVGREGWVGEWVGGWLIRWMCRWLYGRLCQLLSKIRARCFRFKKLKF